MPRDKKHTKMQDFDVKPESKKPKKEPEAKVEIESEYPSAKLQKCDAIVPQVPKIEKEQGLEQQLFEWVDWDDNLPDGFVFYKCTSKVQIGPYPAGTFFPDAYFDIGKSKLTLTVSDEDADEYKDFVVSLKLSIA